LSLALTGTIRRTTDAMSASTCILMESSDALDIDVRVAVLAWGAGCMDDE